MPVKTIFELRILPPFAIARLGSASEPMDNYQLQLDPEDPIGYRQILPADTLMVDQETGEITGLYPPLRVTFKDDEGRIRPVAPFLEVWASFEENGPLLPLTLAHLDDLGLTATDVQWNVHVANIKAFRRTRDPNDQIHAEIGPFSDHERKPLMGQCRNFLSGKSLPLGAVQYIRPNADFPQIRLRFTPAQGRVYGPSQNAPRPSTEPPQGIYVTEVYDVTRGGWHGYADPDNERSNTNPAQIYAGYIVNDKPDHQLWVSRGFLDDECDGIIEAMLTVEGKKLTAFARVAAGPPTFVPDSLPIRTVADELEQALHGPDQVDDTIAQQAAEDIIRRALDAVRHMNTTVMNSPDAGMARMDNLDLNRAKEPILDPVVVDSLAIRARHERVLLALESGTLAWFARMLREYTEVGDVTNEGRRKMPAMMRGADARHLALTRRQVRLVRAAAHALAQSESKKSNSER